MSDVDLVDARKKVIRKLLSETVRSELAEEMGPQLEALREKRDELRALRRELKNTVGELRAQARGVQEAQSDAETGDRAGNPGEGS